jgi:hypothetical protein
MKFGTGFARHRGSGTRSLSTNASKAKSGGKLAASSEQHRRIKVAMQFNWQDRRGDTFMLNVPGVGMFFVCRLSKGKSAPYVTYLDSKLLTDPIYRGKLDDVKAACEKHAAKGK